MTVCLNRCVVKTINFVSEEIWIALTLYFFNPHFPRDENARKVNRSPSKLSQSLKVKNSDGLAFSFPSVVVLAQLLLNGYESNRWFDIFNHQYLWNNLEFIQRGFHKHGVLGNFVTNKNAFQWDAYRPLQWSPVLGVCARGVCARGVSTQWGVCPRGVSAQGDVWPDPPCEQNHRQV